MEFFLKNYLPLVKSKGILILEDIVEVSWTPELLKLIDPSVGTITVRDMREKQFIPAWLEYWKKGLDIIIVEKF